MGSSAKALATFPVTVDESMLAAVSSVTWVIEIEPTMDKSLVVVADMLAEMPVATAVRSPPLSATTINAPVSSATLLRVLF